MTSLIPFDEVCKRLGIARGTGYNWRSKNKFPVRLANVASTKLFVVSTDLENYITSRSIPLAKRGRPRRQVA